MLTLFATCARGLENVLAAEITAFGASRVRPARAGVSFIGDLSVAYRACLWSRTASRVLLAIDKADATTPETLYEAVRAMAWEDHLSPDGTLAVDFSAPPGPVWRNTMFGALKVKDAIVDRLRDKFDRRPSVDPASPDLRVNVRVRSDVATISLDLSGDALHRRGYREPGVQGTAPLKESLAAGALLLAGWPDVAAAGGALFDPMCGSGTFLIEGAWIAGDVAPGLHRARWGFTGWLGHSADTFDDLLAEADDRAEAGLATLPFIAGSDSDSAVVELALANAGRAGLKGRIQVASGRLADATPPPDATAGLLATNPPYGERLGTSADATGIYTELGARLRAAFPGWRYTVLSGEDAHAAALGIVPEKTHELFNGSIPVRLDVGAVPVADAPDVTGGEHAFSNRLRKNVRHLRKWARREGVTCWRAYDADLPDYAVAVDVYECADGVRRAVVSEYEAPREIDPARAAIRLEHAVAAIPEVLEVAPAEVRVKTRRRQRGDAQYERVARTGAFHEVVESGTRLLVNLDDYLDTGLFLDHRITRGMVAELAAGRSLLNLFCYTGAATARAAVAGAARTTSVDLSNTYLDWARRNLELNAADMTVHSLVRADATVYLRDASRSGNEPFDVIFCDPPSFSTSKSMEETLDVQRDHIALLRGCAALLAPGGTIVFSTNLRSFRLDEVALAREGLAAEDVSAATLPPDFVRNPRIHRCFLLRRTT